MDYVDSTYTETVGTVIADKGDIAAALDVWQEKIVSYAEDQGFTVE
jgi:multiple sugar transport system substrate-binding protein